MRRANYLLVTLVLLLGLAGGRGWGQERAAAYWCLEGNFSSDHGHMSYVDAQGTLHKDVLNIPVNAGKKPGITLQYATFYNGKIYAVSKQAKTSSSERLIRINPATWEIEKMGGAGFDGMDKELRTFHFLGVSDKEGYLSGSDARIYKIKLDDLSAEMVEGPGWDDLRDREVGNMILCRGKIVVEVYGHHEGIATDVFQHELWVLNVEDGSVRTKFPYKGLFNPVVTKDGRLLAVRVLGRSVKEKRYFLVELDADNVSAEPKVLLEFSQNMRPADFQTKVWSWSQGYLYASTRENVLYFNTDRGMFQMTSIAKIDLNELKPTEVYKSEILLYGISRENPHDGSIWVNLNGSWSPEDKLVRIVCENGVYKESDRYSFRVPYGFASCPFFEDRHRAEVAKPGRVCKVGVESEVDLCDLVEDKDGFSASVLFSDLKVGGNSGWKFELIDHHLLRVVKTSSAGPAQITLKAFSSGLYSDLMFDFTSYQQLITHTTVGGKVEVLRENDGKILEDATELHKGDVLKISVVPNTEGDYIMKSLRVNGKPWSSGDTYKVEDQSVTVDAEFALRPYSLVVTHTGEGEVKVVRRWEELESGAKVYKGEVLEIEPRPEADYKLKSLKINGEEISGQYKCTVGTGDVEVEAEFVEKPYVLTMKQSGEGKLKVERNGKTLSGGEKVDEGDKLKIIAEPATSYKLKSITVNGALIKSGAVYTVQKGNVEVVGEFEEKPYTLTMEHTGNGRVAALWKSTLLENGAKVDKGDYLTITLVPEAGNKIGSFKINGQVQSGFQATYKVQGEDVHVEAEFIEQPCTLTMKQKGEGTLSVICQKKSLQNGAKIGRGDRLKVKAEPKAGYKLSLLTLNGTSIKSGQERTMFNDEDVEVVAEFVKKSYMLTMKSTGQGELKVSAKGKFLETGTGVDKGEVLIISAEPKLDYELSSLTVNGIDQESGGKFVVDEEDVVVKAEFVEKRYVLTTSHTGDGKVIVKEKGRVLENGSRVSQDEVLSIYVEPGIGWKLSSLNVNGIPKKNGAKTVVSDGDVEVSAEFVQVDYILSVSCFGDGTLTVTRGGDKLKSGAAVRKGEELKLTAAEGHEYTLKSLMVNGEKRKNGELFTVGSEDVIIVVEFVRQVAPVLYTLSYTDPAEGTITVQRGGAKLESGDKTLKAGDELVITAAPRDAAKHELESLKVNGADFTSGGTYKVSGDVTVEAKFKEKVVAPVLYTLSYTDPAEGTITVLRGGAKLESGDKTLKAGDELVITAAPKDAAKHELESLKVNGADFTSGGTYKVSGDVTVEAKFKEKVVAPVLYTLSYTDPAEGTITVLRGGAKLESGDKTLKAGDELVITAAPKDAAKHELASLKVNGADFESGKTFTVGAGDVTVEAKFKEKAVAPVLYTLSYTDPAEGTITVLRGGAKLESGDKTLKAGDELVITAAPKDAAKHELASLKVNGADFESGATFTVGAEDVTVEAKFKEKAVAPVLYTLSYTDPAEGTITVLRGGAKLESGDKTLREGDELVITAEPKDAAKHELASLKVNGADFESGATFTVGAGDVTVEATFKAKAVAPVLYTLSYTDPAEATITVLRGGVKLASGDKTLKAGDELVITAEPKDAAKHELASLKVNGADFESGKTFTVGAGDVTVEATFKAKAVAPVLYTLSYTDPAEGTITVLRGGVKLASGDKTLKAGDELVITAEPKDAAKHELESLKVNGADFKSGGTYKVSGDVTVEATFKEKAVAPVLYTLSYTDPAEGSITVLRGGIKLESGDKTLREGDELVITAEPKDAAKHELESLKVNGADFTSGGTYKVSGDVTVEAKFKEKAVAPVLYTLSYTDPAEGTITVLRGGAKLESGDKTLREGDELVITAAPKDAAKHELESLKVNGADFESGATFTVGAEDVTVEATFKAKAVAPVLYTLSYTDPAEGTITVLRGGAKLASGDKTLKAGDELVITAEPKDAAKHELASLKVNGADFESGKTFTVGAGDVTVEAKFKEKAVAPVLYTLSYTDPAEGSITVLRGGAKLESGDKTLREGDELVITAAPKDAAKHELESLKVNGADFESGATFTVGAEDVTVEATFKPVVYTTLTIIQTGEGMLKVLRGNEELMNGEKLRKGDKLVIEAKPNSSDYKLVTLNVNGTPFASGSTYTVGDQNVRVEVVFDKSTAVESVLLAGVAATPNPCGARLTLRGASAAVQWEVYTVQGQLVARGVSAGEGEIEIATAGWIPGVYYVRLEATDGVRVLPVVKE